MSILPHFRAYIKIRHDIWGKKMFFISKILVRSIQKKKKNQGDVFWEFDLEHICKNSKKNLFFVFLKKRTIMA